MHEHTIFSEGCRIGSHVSGFFVGFPFVGFGFVSFVCAIYSLLYCISRDKVSYEIDASINSMGQNLNISP